LSVYDINLIAYIFVDFLSKADFKEAEEVFFLEDENKKVMRK